MIEMSVDRVAKDPNNEQRIVWLRTLQGNRLIPIVIGEGEAFSIALGLTGQEAPRPLAHDLIRSILERLHATIEKVEIVSMKDGTFFAELTLAGPNGEVSMDARPSDCLALALRAGAPIYVTEDILSAEGIAEEKPLDASREPVAGPADAVDRTVSLEDVDTAIQSLIRSAGLEAREETAHEDTETFLGKLRWRLELAVKGEEYERAALLRDEIARRTKKGGSISGP